MRLAKLDVVVWVEYHGYWLTLVIEKLLEVRVSQPRVITDRNGIILVTVVEKSVVMN